MTEEEEEKEEDEKDDDEKFGNLRVRKFCSCGETKVHISL